MSRAQARDKLIAAALSCAAHRIYIEASPPGPHDDAQMELDTDLLDLAVNEYVQARVTSKD